MKTCSKCKIEKELSEFNKCKKTKDGYYCVCTSCRKLWRQEHREELISKKKKYYKENSLQIRNKVKQYASLNKSKIKEISKIYYDRTKDIQGKKRKEFRAKNKDVAKGWYLKGQYNLSIEEYNKKVEQQQGLCFICGKLPTPKGLFVDHNHKTKQVRDLLCLHCNFIVGHSFENDIILQNVIKYLERHKCL